MNPFRGLESFLTLTAVDLSLALFGCNRTIRWVRRLTRVRLSEPPDSVQRLQDLRQSCALAGKIYPRQTECLSRSLTIFAMARRRGIPVQFRIGVRKFPFTSHAWLDMGGPVFVEDASLVATLTPILTVD